VVYQLSGSIWPAVGLHWLAVVVWLERLGGQQKLAAGAARAGERVRGMGVG
jgi:predicted Abi (CAAX) family protease